MADAVADTVESAWPSEEIPDGDLLFMRVHRQYFNPDGSIQPGVFKNQGEGMSTDWSKYADPEYTRSQGRMPEENGVISLIAGDARHIPGQIVVHTPDRIKNNRAHTDVYGEKKKDPEIRVRFSRICRLVLPLS